jgi:hypothetical protein
MPTDHTPNAAADRLEQQADGWALQGGGWHQVAADIRTVVAALRMYSERLSQFQIAPPLAEIGNGEAAIVAAADEIIRTGYSQTNGVITTDALRYRLTGIIARHVLAGEGK